MLNCNSAETPAEARLNLVRDGDEEEVNSTEFRQMVGALRYLCNTRPNIAFCVGVISRVMDRPSVSHLMAAKWIMRYLKGTMSYGILFPCKRSENLKKLYGYSDANWCGDKNDRKSTVGFVFFAGTTPVSWCSKKEVVVALSSCEANTLLLQWVSVKQYGLIL
ncbi:secreted RxLR effector protein 161-like [Medicago truncatula]|uniref:secreted RxLR effector protein 161-like n=1 Tax=Medicago truncatula TaxID=3880 RepID=UPI00196871CC|nr:secreted RxLR effector protein 161-like [Medicago truncatula]